jgi:phosphate:Na+ symporter
MLPLIGPFAKFVVYISPSPAEGLTGLEAAASVLPHQVANAHTLFNVGIAVLFLPFIAYFARFVFWLVPDKPIEEVEEIQPKYLSEMLFHTPSLALDAAPGSREQLQAVREMDEEVDVLYKHIVNYLAKVSKLKLNEFQTHKLVKLMEAVNDLEHIGDLIEVNLVDLGEQRIKKGFKISEKTQKVINTVHHVVSDALKAAVRAIVDEDKEFAMRVISMKSDMDRLVEKANMHQAERLVSEDSGKFEAYSVEIDIIEKLKRIYYHSKRMAKAVVEIGEGAVILEAA